MWQVIGKFHPAAAALADGHYSRRTHGSPQFMPPGQTLIMISDAADAIFGWWRPHPASGLKSMNGFDGWTCTIFRNTGPTLSSEMILEAERILLAKHDVGPDGLMTYVWDKKIRSTNPGYCFKRAGYRAVGRSADGRKTLLRKYPAAMVSAVEQIGTERLRNEKMNKLFENGPSQALAKSDPAGRQVQRDIVRGLISGVKESRASTPIAGGKPFLRLQKSGKLVFGASDDPIQDGSEWAINPYSIGHGWVCWTNPDAPKPTMLGEAMAPITSKKPICPDPISGGEWKEQRAFDLKCLNGDDEGTEIQYKVNSKGGMRAVDNLFGKLTDHWEAEAEAETAYIVPIVQLSSDYYTHDRYGQTFFPVFTISGWMGMDGDRLDGDEAFDEETDEVTQAAPAKSAKPVKEPLPQRPGAPPRRQRPGGRV